MTTRREFLGQLLGGILYGSLFPFAAAADDCAVQHPLMPPSPAFSGQCPNCGMARSMWARTWKTAETTQGRLGLCSFHCLADLALKSGQDPVGVWTALYLDPNEMIPVESAVFVVGSRAPGTMTATSKLAFPNVASALQFSKFCGGRAVSFEEALSAAKEGTADENKIIVQKRLDTGRLVEPVDNRTECTVCLMFPARYPAHKCQVMSGDHDVYHFCSTQCLFTFLEDPRQYAHKDVAPALIWVVDHTDGSWISGRTAYYVVGSNQWGPMGYEAFTFERLADAQKFLQRNGGTVLLFKDMSIRKIKPY